MADGCGGGPGLGEPARGQDGGRGPKPRQRGGQGRVPPWAEPGRGPASTRRLSPGVRVRWHGGKGHGPRRKPSGARGSLAVRKRGTCRERPEKFLTRRRQHGGARGSWRAAGRQPGARGATLTTARASVAAAHARAAGPTARPAALCPARPVRPGTPTRVPRPGRRWGADGSPSGCGQQPPEWGGRATAKPAHPPVTPQTHAPGPGDTRVSSPSGVFTTPRGWGSPRPKVPADLLGHSSLPPRIVSGDSGPGVAGHRHLLDGQQGGHCPRPVPAAAARPGRTGGWACPA